MTTYTELIRKGERERETGDVSQSIQTFLEAVQQAETDADRSMAYAHLGLAYRHQGDWVQAQHYYEEALRLGEQAQNRARVAEAKRHLAMCYLQTQRPTEAFTLAREAWAVAVSINRTDLPWFSHGILAVVFDLQLPFSEKLHWLLVETGDLIGVWNKEKNKIARRVWFEGLLIDWAKALKPLSLPLLLLALLIAKAWKLKRREAQIRELL